MQYLTVDDVRLVHDDQLTRYGGAPGLRDEGRLSAAVEVARAGFEGHRLHPDIWSIAAAYLYHLVRGHPFVDGNKRTGVASALLFLAMHQVEIDASDDELVEFVLDVASGNRTKDQVAAFLRQHATV